MLSKIYLLLCMNRTTGILVLIGVASFVGIVVQSHRFKSSLFLQPNHWNKGWERIETSICADLDALTTGTWDNSTKQWHPRTCIHQMFDREMLDQCIGNRSIGLYGDSTLRNIAIQLIKLDDKEIHLNAVGELPSYTLGSGRIAQGRLSAWWTPSAWYQTPANIGDMAREDVSIISISAWDMGIYYRGVDVWFRKMRTVIESAARKRKGKPLYIMHIHKLFASNCEKMNSQHNYDLCLKCNKEESLWVFRNALASAVKCVLANNYTNVHLIDTLGVTDSPFAKNQSNGVHFGHEVTHMELQVVLAAICSGLHHPPERINALVCPETPEFEVGFHSECPISN